MMRRRRFCKKCLAISLATLIIVFLLCKMKSPETTVPEQCQVDQEQFLTDIDVSLTCVCDQFRFKSSSYVDSFVNGFNSLGERHKTILYLNLADDGQKVVLKYRRDSKRLRDLSHLKTASAEKERMLRELLSGNKFNQPHFCSHPVHGNAFGDMLSLLDEPSQDNLLVANMNFEIILLKFLKSSGLPVPEFIANCGLYLMESYGGSTMDHFYKAGIESRLRIARNLLSGAQALTNGYRGFRIYLTDATKDNIAVDEDTLAVTFIDLDDVIIINGGGETDNQDAHQHRKIECDNCFAYSPEKICGSSKSDLNIFTICQLLLEDLSGNEKKGFLYFQPEVLQNYSKRWRDRFSNLLRALRECVYCDSRGLCPDRFHLVGTLIEEIDILLKFSS